MNKTQFWKLIEASRREARGDDRMQEKALEKRLRTLSPSEIVNFNNHFDEYETRAYHWDLWGAIYIINQGCGDDSFSDFRSWLVSRGEKIYRAALRNPETLLKVVKPSPKAAKTRRKRRQKLHLRFLNPAAFVWEEKTGKDIFDMPSRESEQTEPAGKEWAEDEEELKQRFPKIWEKHGW